MTDWQKPVGLTLAIASGGFIGTSFILKKKGLMESEKKHGDIGSGHAYLSSPLWWTGLFLMILGEICNFGAYAFVPAILVTPLGALSVVVSTVLSSIFLNETLNLGGKIGCAQCVMGAVIIVLNSPETSSTSTIPEFFSYVIAPGFLIYTAINVFVILYIIYQVSPRYGDKYPIVYISICSMVGSFLVVSIQGLGAAIVYSAANWTTDNQFRYWNFYLLISFVLFAVMSQIHFLNKALNKFSSSIVVPVYYVFFTTMTLITSAVLFQGFPVSSVNAGILMVMGFLVIVGGVALLFEYNSQMNAAKELEKLENKRMTMIGEDGFMVAPDEQSADETDDDDEMFPQDESDEESDNEYLIGFSDDETILEKRKVVGSAAASSIFNLFGSKKMQPDVLDDKVSISRKLSDKVSLKQIAESNKQRVDQANEKEVPPASLWSTFASRNNAKSIILESEAVMPSVLESLELHPKAPTAFHSSLKQNNVDSRNISSANSSTNRSSNHHARFAPPTTNPYSVHNSQTMSAQPQFEMSKDLLPYSIPYTGTRALSSENNYHPSKRVFSSANHMFPPPNISHQRQQNEQLQLSVQPRVASPNADRFFADLENRSTQLQNNGNTQQNPSFSPPSASPRVFRDQMPPPSHMPANQYPNTLQQQPKQRGQPVVHFRPQFDPYQSPYRQTPRIVQPPSHIHYQRQMGFVASNSKLNQRPNPGVHSANYYTPKIESLKRGD